MASVGFKKLKFGNTRNVHRHTGKGSSSQMLPSRTALNTLTSGDVNARTMNDYAKATPGPNTPTPDMDEMSVSGINPLE